MNGTPQPGKWDESIDAALRSTARATPEPGLEGRILTRLAAERVAAPPLGWRRYSMPIVGFAAVSLVCAVIVGGSVEHARMSTGPAPAPPVLALPGQGVGAASAVHPASPASAPLPAGVLDHGRAVHRLGHPLSHGRARIAAHAHRARGVVPAAAGPQN